MTLILFLKKKKPLSNYGSVGGGARVVEALATAGAFFWATIILEVEDGDNKCTIMTSRGSGNISTSIQQ